MFIKSSTADEIQTCQVKACNYWIVIQSLLFFTGIKSQLKKKFMRFLCLSSHSGDMILTVKHNVDTFCLMAINNNLSSQYHCSILHRWLLLYYKTWGLEALKSIKDEDKKEKMKKNASKERSRLYARMTCTGLNSRSVWPQSSVPLIYCWLTCCADLYLHYLPSFHHKPQIYDFSECQGPKNLVSFSSLSSRPSLSFPFFKGFQSLPYHPTPPPLLLCWLGV